MKRRRLPISWALLAFLPVWAAVSPAAASGPADVLVPEGEPYEKLRPLLDRISVASPIRSVAFSPDGFTLASGSARGTVRLWNVASGREQTRFEGHGARVRSVAFSPNSRMLASASDDRTVRLWDVASGRERAPLEGHGARVRSVAFSPDGRTLASASDDRTVRLWDVASGREQARLEGHGAGVSSVAFSPDGRTLASASDDRTVRLWDLAHGREQTRLEVQGDLVLSVAFSPDGRTLASGSQDRTVYLWDVASGREQTRLAGHGDWVWSVAFSPDGRTLASGSDDRTVSLWDVASGRERARLESHGAGVSSVAFSPDGRTLASGSNDGTVRLWNVASGRERMRLEGHGGPLVLSVAFSPDGRTLASGCDDKTVRLWDSASGRELALLEGHEKSVLSVAFSPDGRTLASGSADNSVRLWDVAGGRERMRLGGHGEAIWSVAFSPDGRTLASGSRDKSVRLWNMASGRERARLESYGEVWSVAFSPNGLMLAGGSGENSVRLWDVTDGRERALFAGYGSPVFSVAFSPDSHTLAIAEGKTVRLTDLTQGREWAQLEGHDAPVLFVAFSPDGRTLASGSDDGTARLWDGASGHARAILEGHGDSVHSVAFSPDGRTLASGSRDSTARLWELASRSDSHDKTVQQASSAKVGEKAIFYSGRRGTWAACLASLAKCFHRDDGTLITVVDSAGRLTPRRPPGEPQPLEVALTRPARPGTIVADPTEVLSLEVEIRNRGQGRAFWVGLVPEPGQSSVDWALEPFATLPFVEADGEPTKLEARIHLLPNGTNPAAFETTIRLAVAQAYGEPIALEPLTVKILPPVLEIEKAVLQRDGGQRTITVTVQNTGSTVGPLAVRLEVLGLARQPAELTERGIAAGKQITWSFGLEPDEKLPSDLRATLKALTVPDAFSSRPALFDWEWKDLPVSSGLPWALIALAAALTLALAAGAHYQRTYRNPAVVRLTASPAALREVEPGDLDAATRALNRASRLEPVLRGAGVDPSWLAAAVRMGGTTDGETRLALLAKRLGLEPVPAPPGGLPSLTLPLEFPINLLRLRLRALDASEVAQDVFNELGRAGEVTLALGASAEQRRELSALARRRPGMVVAPDGPELTRLMLAGDPQDELARLIARYVPVTQISPYQTGAGVHRQGLFFGRSGILAQIMGRDPANYLVVGGRQVGKSSLLKEVLRRFEGHSATDCRYLVLTGDTGVALLAQALGLPVEAGIPELLDAFRNGGRRHTLFLLDEADVFIESESRRGYETLQALRALSEEGYAHFMLAGFWSLYRQAALDYQSPLKNFGTVHLVGALERDACRLLATEPMERLGVGWESDALVERLIDETGQRANLISIACDEALNALGPSERTISPANLEAVLDGNRIRDALLGWGALGPSEAESRLDRIVVYAMVDRESFTLTDLLSFLEQAGFAADTEGLKNSLARLELAFVLGRRGNEYFFRVPLQRELIRADDTGQLLRSEIRAAGQASKA